MDRKVVGTFLLTLGLLLVVVAGGVAGDTQTGIDARDGTDVRIDDALHDADGEIEVVVQLAGSETATTTDQLRTYASAAQEPLVQFANARAGVAVVNQFWLGNLALLEVDTDRFSLSEVAEVDNVVAIHENSRYTLDTGSAAGGLLSDPVSAANGSYTYGLEQINAPTAWENYNTKGEGASIAVLDTGVDADHPDIDLAGWQEFDGDGNPVDSQPNDGDGHGTHVSGTATGAANPAGDVPSFGVAPNADLYGVKVLEDNGGGSFVQIIAGMQWAVDQNVDIISMSLGATGFYDQMIAPVQDAHAAGTVVITSAGNSGAGSSGSPGNVYDSIAVGASNSDQGIASFSSGEVVDTAADWGSSAPGDWPSQYTVPTIAAPGVETLSSVPGGGYDDTYSGTSMAAPHVSGAVALAESATNGSLSPAIIEEALEATAFKPSDAPAPPGERDTRYGSGMIDADALIAYLQGVEDEPLLTVTASAPDTIEPGATLTVNYTVENIGGAEGSESGIDLLVEGSVEDSDGGVTLAPGESTSGTLSFGDTAQYDGQLVNWTVELQDTGKTASGQTGVGAQPGAEIVIQSIDYPSSIAPSDSLSIDYTLENLGLEDGTESFVDLIIDGTDSDFDDTDSDVTVPGGGTTSGTLTFDDVSGYFGDGDTIDFSVELWDFGDVAEGTTDVGGGEEPPGEPDIVIQSIDYNETVQIGGGLSVDYTLENVGGADGQESFVDLIIDGTDNAYDDTDFDVNVSAGGTTSGTLSFDGIGEYYEPRDTINFSVELFDFGDVAEGQATYEVPDEPILQLASVDAPTTIEAGDDLTVNYTIENIGGVEGTESAVDLLVDGELGDTDANVTVPAQDSVSGSLTFESVSAGQTLEMLGETDSRESVSTDGGPTVAESLRTADGTTEVIVEFAGAPDVTTTDQLQTHADSVLQPLQAFAAKNAAVSVERTFWLNPMALVEIDLDRTSVAELTGLQNVEAIYENARFRIDTASTGGLLSDPVSAANGSYTYGLEQINAPTTWEKHDTNGSGVSLAVLDTGVAASHPDLEVAKWQEFDGDGNPVDSQPNDGQGHGTHVSGTATGALNPAGDVPSFGVAPGADLYGVKVLEDSGGGSFAQIIAGMEWATNESVDIISMSLGATGFYDQMIEPVQNAHAAGTVVITSAGNSGAGSSGSPGNVYESIAVGASNSNQGIARFSSGEVVDTAADWSSPPADWPDQYTVPTIAAPGVNTLSSVPGGGYDDTYSGTSMAAPHVSGAVALALSATEEDVTPSTIEEALEATAFKPSDAPAPPGERDTRYGSGIIDADALTEYLKSPPEGETVSYTVTLEDTNVSQTGEVFVENASEDPPGEGDGEFTVNVTGANVPVAGEELDVLVDIENVGNATDTQTLDLTVDGLGSTSANITLDAGESTEANMTLGTEVGDAGQYEAVVASEDDQDTEPILVVAPPEFHLEILNATESVEEGQSVEVTAEIENVGDVDDTQTVTLDVGTLGSDSAEVSLPFGESTQETFSVGTSEGDAGQYEAVVASDDDSENVTVDVAGDLQIVGVEAPTIVEGETLTVTAIVENIADGEGTSTVSASVAGVGDDSASVTLGPGESTNLTLNIATDFGQAGEYDLVVETPQDSLTDVATLTLPELPNQDAVPTDVDGDDLYEDADGNGVFDIFDVVVFFNTRDDPMMDDHGWAFDYDGDGNVSIFDVQAQFTELAES